MFIPAIVNKYGNWEVDFKITVLPESMCEFSQDKIYASVNTRMDISIQGDGIL